MAASRIFFERHVTSATKLLCGTAEEDHVPLPSDVVHKQQLYQQRGVSRCTTHVCYVRPLATGCISYKSTHRSWLLISRFKQRRTFAMRPPCGQGHVWLSSDALVRYLVCLTSRVHFSPPPEWQCARLQDRLCSTPDQRTAVALHIFRQLSAVFGPHC